jgi:hypothetical protein
MLQSYILSEKDSDQVFGIIKDLETTKIGEGYPDLINKVGQAIEDEFCYDERIKIVHGSVINSDLSGIPCIYMQFRCIDDCGEEEIREVQLLPIAIY